MSIAVVGSVAFDSVTTPFASAERELGGSAAHAATAAALFTEAHIVAPIGDDFRPNHVAALTDRGIITNALEYLPGEKTFFWRGRYDFDLSVAHSEETELNGFAHWKPELSAVARETDMLFLASMDPRVQRDVRAQWSGTKWSALDSIAFWIQLEPKAVIDAIGDVDIVLLNDDEIRLLTGEPVLLAAAREVMALGPQAVVIKQGAYGCSLLTADGYFALPGYPLEVLTDPTGTGDAFAGGFLGCLDLFPGDKLNEAILRRAITYGCIVASYCAEEFGTRRVSRLTMREVENRVAGFKAMTHFEHVLTNERLEERPDPTRERQFAMPSATAGTQTYGEPGPTGGTPSYGAPEPSAGTPAYKSPHGTPGTQPLKRPKRGPAD